jgi:phytoene synthase
MLTQKKRIHSPSRINSRTYLYVSLFFPASIRGMILILFSFIRKAESYTDGPEGDREGFSLFRKHYEDALEGKPSHDAVIDSFIDLMHHQRFTGELTRAFLDGCEADLEKRRFRTIREVEDFLYGSAEVIGLLLARILGLPEDTWPHARRLASAFQFLNLVRDIHEDCLRDRIYLPMDETSLEELNPRAARSDPDEFNRFIRNQVRRYRNWQEEAEQVFEQIPKKYRLPVLTLADLYAWMALRIERDPFLVFRIHVAPSLQRILTTATANTLRPGRLSR